MCMALGLPVLLDDIQLIQKFLNGVLFEKLMIAHRLFYVRKIEQSADWLDLDYYLYYPFLSRYDENEDYSELRRALLLLKHKKGNGLNNQWKSKEFILARSRITNTMENVHKTKLLKPDASYAYQKSVYDLSRAVYTSVA